MLSVIRRLVALQQLIEHFHDQTWPTVLKQCQKNYHSCLQSAKETQLVTSDKIVSRVQCDSSSINISNNGGYRQEPLD